MVNAPCEGGATLSLGGHRAVPWRRAAVRSNAARSSIVNDSWLGYIDAARESQKELVRDTAALLPPLSSTWCGSTTGAAAGVAVPVSGTTTAGCFDPQSQLIKGGLITEKRRGKR